MTNPTTPQQSDREALLPCPFCEDADVGLYRPALGRIWRVHCMACEAIGPSSVDRGLAATLWNDRPHLQQARLEERERAGKLLDDLAEIARAGAIGGHCDPLDAQLLDGAYSGAAEMIRKHAIRKGEAE